MDRIKAEAMLGEAKAELVTARSAVAYLEQVVSGLEGLLKTSPEVARPVFAQEVPAEPPQAQASIEARSFPTPRDAVLAVLQRRPNYRMTFSAIWDEMAKADVIDPAIKSGRNAYTNAARRLAEDPSSPVERDGLGLYSYRTDRPVSVPAPSPEGAPEPFLKAVYTS